MRAGSRAALFMATLAMLALSAETSRLASTHAQSALGGGAVWEGILQGSTAVSAVAAGVVLILQRRVIACGLFLALTGPAIALAQLPVPELGSGLLFTAALTCGSWAPALAGCAAITSPVRPLLRLDWTLIILTLVTAVAIQGLLSTAVYDPRAAGCFGCAANLAEIHAAPGLYSRLGHWGLILTVAWGIALPARACWRWLAAAPVVREAQGLLVLAGSAIAVLAACAATHELLSTTQEIDGTLTTLWLAQCGLVLLMALGVAIDGRRARQLARAMTAEVVTSTPSPEVLRAMIGASINDSALELLFLRDNGVAIDATGGEVPYGQRSSAVLRVNRGDMAAEVRYDSRLVGASYRLVSVVRAAGLAIEHVAAHAGLQAELSDLAAARLRIVTAGDAERRRLERDLHDGAQQRLIALQVYLQLAASTASPDVGKGYRAARTEIGIALEELRDLAHGIHPAALTDGGLGTGLLTLAETSPVPLIVAGDRAGRHPAPAEAAAYRLVADALHVAGQVAGRPAITVTIDGDDDVLRARLTVAGLDATVGEGIVSRAIDRVAALDGSVALAQASDSVTIEVVIPCAS
jgi:signal transduction histidine kinase